MILPENCILALNDYKGYPTLNANCELMQNRNFVRNTFSKTRDIYLSHVSKKTFGR